jgi:carbamoyl-phosphate synthase small subunit
MIFCQNVEGSVSHQDSLPVKLVLDDGMAFDGYSLGYKTKSPTVGEVVFNTGMVGYTEAMTDPSYSGQILCFTYPLIGNYGVADYTFDENGICRGFESTSIKTKAIIVNRASKTPSHYRMKRSLHQWMESEGISGIEGVDTRELTLQLREKGVMMGAIAPSVQDAVEAIHSSGDYSSMDFCKQVSTKSPVKYGKNICGEIAIVDCGLKLNIVRSLVQRGFGVTVFPYETKFEELDSGFGGIVISNGPGDPKNCSPAIELARTAIEKNIPTLGICLGTQIVALSLGADTFKLKYGHRGQNKPCIDLKTGRCLVTSQNHGYSVDDKSLEGTGLEPWFMNADDRTLEGLMHKSKPCISVQFHPEASPGPVDAAYVFDIFRDLVLRKS